VVRVGAGLLGGVVSSMGYLEGDLPHGRELVLPTGTSQLLVNLDTDRLSRYEARDDPGQHTCGAALQGVSARPAVVDATEQRAVLWIAFRPGGTHPFLPLPASAATDQLVPLDALWGRDGAVLRERLLAAGTPEEKLAVAEAVLLSWARRSPEPDPAVAFAVTALHRGAPVATVADRLGWTPKRLARRFTDHVGLTPKRFARVRRFQRLVRAVTSGGDGAGRDWARLAAECGYHDQAHMIHDFREFSGLSPTAYAPRSPADQNHVPLPG
jgi:AraC-like DNA-binding protein